MFWLKLLFLWIFKWYSVIPWKKRLRQVYRRVKAQNFLLKIFLYIRLIFRLLKKRKISLRRVSSHALSFFLHFGKARGKATGQKSERDWARVWGVCVSMRLCILQPVSVVALPAMTEAGAQPQKAGKKHPPPLLLACLHPPLIDLKGHCFGDTFLRMEV